VGGSGPASRSAAKHPRAANAPRQRTIRVEGRDITQMSISQCVPSRPLWRDVSARSAVLSLTVLQNVQLPMLGIFTFLCTSGIARMLKVRLAGLPDDACRKFPSQLSGGMIKRAAWPARSPSTRACCFSMSPHPAWIRSAAAEFDELILYLQKQLD